MTVSLIKGKAVYSHYKVRGIASETPVLETPRLVDEETKLMKRDEKS